MLYPPFGRVFSGRSCRSYRVTEFLVQTQALGRGACSASGLTDSSQPTRTTRGGGSDVPGIQAVSWPQQLQPGRGCWGCCVSCGRVFPAPPSPGLLLATEPGAVERVWWEDRRSTAFRGRQTSVLHPFPPPPGSVTLASDRGYALVSSFGKGRHPTSQGASSVQ